MADRSAATVPKALGIACSLASCFSNVNDSGRTEYWRGTIHSNASQPGFLAYNSADDSGLGATTVTVDLDTEVYDNAGNFSTDTFTAPVTGTYELCGTTYFLVLVDVGELRIQTSNRDYQVAFAGEKESVGGCVFADMDAADTASLRATFNVSPNTLGGGASPLVTFFSGRLLP